MSTKKTKEKDPFAKCAIGLRKKLKLTKTTVAKQLELSRQSIVIWELSRRIPKNRRAQIIAKLREKARLYNDCAEKLEFSTLKPFNFTEGGSDEA